MPFSKEGIPMICRGREVSTETEAQIVQAYTTEGMSVHLLHMRHYPVSRRQIEEMLRKQGVLRARSTPRSADPSHEEIEERAAEIRQAWTEEEARKRWVGRSAQFFQSSLVGER